MEKIIRHLEAHWPIYIIAFISLTAKVLFLDERPMHHDESLHAQYGKYFANSFTNGYYKYDPLLHGPFLYHLQGLWTWLFGPFEKFGARSLAVIFGFSLSLSPLLFRHKIKRTTLYFIMFVLAISPSFTFWSRFLRHDFLAIIALTIGAWVWIIRPRHYALYLGLAAGAHFATKENFFVHAAIILGYLITEAFFYRRARLPNLTNTIQFILGFFIVALPLYTAWFQYMEGIVDGLYRKSLVYWFTQHHQERIQGPFYFNALIISIYETWLIPLFGFLAFSWLKKTKLNFRLIDLAVIAIFILLTAIATVPLPDFVLVWLKIKTNLDIFFFGLSFYAAIRTTFHFLKRNQSTYAFWSYATFASFFTYSYLGEKVPWLAIYPTLCCFILVTLIFEQSSTKFRLTCFILIGLMLPKMIYVNHLYPGDERELISQVHTTKEYENVALKLKWALETPVGQIKPRVLVLKDNGWPLSWYIWGLPGVDYRAPKTNYHLYDFVFDELVNSKSSYDLQKTHVREALPLRHYWWPDFNTITFNRWIKLALFHQPWSDIGSYRVALWRKKEGFFSE